MPKKRDNGAVPVRLSEKILERLDGCAEKLGIKRAQLIRYLVVLWLDYYDEHGGKVVMPPDMKEVVRVLDGRAWRYQDKSGAGEAIAAERKENVERAVKNISHPQNDPEKPEGHPKPKRPRAKPDK